VSAALVSARPVAVTAMLVGALVSYQGPVAQAAGYGLAGLGILLLLASEEPGLAEQGRALLGLWTAAGVVAAALSLVAAPTLGAGDALMLLSYPLVTAALVSRGRVLDDPFTARVLACIGVANGVVATANSLVGPLSLPLGITLDHHRAIFLTAVPSSAGLVSNVNYYAIVQVLIGWALVGTADRAVRPPGDARNRWLRPLAIAVMASSIVGSSRGGVLSLLASALAYTVLRIRGTAGRAMLAASLGAIVTAGAVVVHRFQDVITVGLRIYKGLNDRDVIWEAARELFTSRPWLGWASVSTVETELLLLGSTNASVQSTWIMLLLRNGLVGTALLTALLVAVTLVVVRDARLRHAHAWAIALVVAWVVNSFVRTFSLGGIGFVPLLAALAIGRLLATTGPRSSPPVPAPAPAPRHPRPLAAHPASAS
jgi:hypothetical protein